jgi:hypothetical protein
VGSEETLGRLKNEIASKDIKIEEFKARLRDSDKQKERL